MFLYQSYLLKYVRVKCLDNTTVLSVFVCLFVLLFRAASAAYEGSQARGLIGATAAGLNHGHSNARSEPHLEPTPQLTAMLDHYPLREARDRTQKLMIPNRIHFCCTTMGTPATTVLLKATFLKGNGKRYNKMLTISESR